MSMFIGYTITKSCDHFQTLFQLDRLPAQLLTPRVTFHAMDFNLTQFQNTLTSFPSTDEIRTILTNLLALMGCMPNFFNNNGILGLDISKFIQTIFIRTISQRSNRYLNGP